MNVGKILNVGYANTFATYWMYYGVSNAFASAFLLTKGYTNAEIGIILAAGSVLAVFLQPIFADIADRSKRISVLGFVELSAILLIVLEAGLFIFTHKSLALWTIFVVTVAWHIALQPLLNSLASRLEASGEKIYFGICRGIGSLGFALLTAVLGTAVEAWGEGILPIVGEACLFALLITVIIVNKTFKNAVKRRNSTNLGAEINDAESVVVTCNEIENLEGQLEDGEGLEGFEMTETVETGDDAEDINLWRFITENKLFVVMNLGVIVLYFSNAVLNNFMLQIVEAVGGTSEDMGRVLSVMAFMEMPALFFFDKIKERFSCQTLIKVAAIGFTLRVGVIYLADSMLLIYLAHIFQTLGFALFLPSIVVFTGQVMRPGEAVKGQAWFTTMTTAAATIGSVIGGVLLDMRDASFMLLVSTIVTATGAALIIAIVGKIKRC